MCDGESRSVLAAWMGRRLRRHTAWRVLGQFLLYEKGGIRGGPRPTNYSRPAGGTGRTGSHRIRGQGNANPTKGEARRQGGNQGRVAGQRARRGPRRLRGR